MAEIKTPNVILQNELRPCYVDGKKALFHKWAEQTKVLLKFNALMTFQDQIELLNDYKERGIIDPCCDVEQVKNTVAIVEYDDGAVAEVEPCKIRFADNKINEYAL